MVLGVRQVRACGWALLVPLLGGSLPLVRFQEALGTPLVIVPMVNHDNNQHAEDENLRIGNLWRGIEMYAALFAHLGVIVSGPIIPAILYSIFKDRGPFVREQSREALNFGITAFIGYIAAVILGRVLGGAGRRCHR